MLIQIEVQPDTAALVHNAAARGISLDRVLRSALEDAETGSSARGNGSSGADSVSPQEIDEQLDILAGGSRGDGPVLPREADSRHFCYEERI